MCGSGRKVVNVAFRLFRMKYAQSSMNPWCVFFSVALYLWRCYMWIFTFTKVMLWNVHPFFQLWFYEELDLPTLTFDGVISGSYFSYFLYCSYFFMRFLLEGQEDHYIIHLVWFMYLLLPLVYIYEHKLKIQLHKEPPMVYLRWVRYRFQSIRQFTKLGVSRCLCAMW